VVSELEEPCLHDHSTQRHPPAKTHRQHGAYKRLQRYGFPREPHGAADEFVAPSRSKLVTSKERDTANVGAPRRLHHLGRRLRIGKGMARWWGLEGPEYLAWLGEQPEATYLMGANTYRLMAGFAAGEGPEGQDEVRAEEE